MGRGTHLEKAAANAERQIWRRAQSLSPQSPVPSGYFVGPDQATAQGEVQWSMSSVEALDQMQKNYEAKLESVRAQYQKEGSELRKENSFLKQRLKGVVATHNHELRSNHQHAQLQATIQQLQSELELRNIELNRAREETARLSQAESSMRTEVTKQKRAWNQRTSLEMIGAVLVQWTTNALFGAIVVWRTSLIDQKPAQIDRAKVRALESEASSYRIQIRQLVADVKEALELARSQKREHADELKSLRRDRNQLENMLSQSSENAESITLRREILKLKDHEKALLDEVSQLKRELRLKGS